MTSVDVGSAGNAFEADGGGTISNTAITDNYATMDTANGVAQLSGAGLGTFGNASLLTVRNTTTTHPISALVANSGASAQFGAAQAVPSCRNRWTHLSSLAKEKP